MLQTIIDFMAYGLLLCASLWGVVYVANWFVCKTFRLMGFWPDFLGYMAKKYKQPAERGKE